MSFTEKEKEIFNKGLKIYREEKEKSMNEFYERIEKELEVSTEEYKNIQGRVKKVSKAVGRISTTKICRSNNSSNDTSFFNI